MKLPRLFRRNTTPPAPEGEAVFTHPKLVLQMHSRPYEPEDLCVIARRGRDQNLEWWQAIHQMIGEQIDETLADLADETLPAEKLVNASGELRGLRELAARLERHADRG